MDEPDQQQHHSENSPDSDENKFPSIWTPNQADEFQKDHPWLLFSNGCLGCRTCKQVKNFGVFKTQGIKTSKRWLEWCVTFNGKTGQSQLSSLRKKIYEHEKGQQHQVAEEICLKAKNKDMETVVCEQQKTSI